MGSTFYDAGFDRCLTNRDRDTFWSWELDDIRGAYEASEDCSPSDAESFAVGFDDARVVLARKVER